MAVRATRPLWLPERRRGSAARLAAWLGALALSAGLLAGFPTPAHAAVSFPGDFQVDEVTSALKAPHAMKFAPDGRLFVLEQRGNVRVVKNGALLAKPALTLTVPTGNSNGLIGLAFDPSFATNGHLYLFYTRSTPKLHNRVSRFTAEGDTVDPASEFVLTDLEDLGPNPMHYGGDLGFGPDGKLYVTVGDNTRGPDAQKLTNRFGKILRYNADGSIPADNPFYAQTAGDNRAIWAMGLRNPFRLSFHPTTGQMIVGDVGGSSWEELNVGKAGANYGWPIAEGNSTNPAYTNPLVSYPHTNDGSGVFGCAVMGGDFYPPAARTFPASFWNKYLVADHCEGWLRVVDPATGTSTTFGSGFELPVDFKVGPDGSLYTLQRSLNGKAKGVLYKVSYVGGTAQPPQIGAQPEDVTAGLGGTATFNVLASGTAPLTYQWRRDGADIPGATNSSYTLTGVQQSDDGARFSVVVANAHGSLTSREALLSVRNNQPPAAAITNPAPGATYVGGQQFTITGAGTDPEDGTIPPDDYEWEVVFHHNTHTHPFVEPFTGTTSFNVTIPVDNETAADVFYRVHLRVTDKTGITTEVVRDIAPQLSTVHLQAQPHAWELTLDGSPVATPTSFAGVVGIRRTLGAPPRTVAGKAWVLDCWEDYTTAGERVISTPAIRGRYTAIYRRDAGSVGTGTGLAGEYFANKDFTQPVLTRVDRVLYANWSGSPGGEAPRNFSTRWTGELQGQFTGSHTLYMASTASDKFRVWLGGTKIFDTFSAPTNVEQTATVALQAGQRYPVTIEYVDDTGLANLALRWSGPSLPKSAVPGSQLYPRAA